jgi:RNA polymerase sigma factor (sigma-70 family)
VEASALRAPAGVGRLPLRLPLLRVRSDEQLLALFRAGSDEAFGVIHDRYRQRLFAYVRQMLAACSRQDAEDVMQDVFVRAYGALRDDVREVNVRAWLYRVAHNRCIDHLRRPVPPAAEIFELSRKPLHDPIEEAQRREDLARLVEDVGRLPDQQRSALLMREIDGMSYADLAGALDVTVPAVKSLLVRARIGLVEAAEARDADCAEIRQDLVEAYDRGVKASGRARRHMRTCDGCTEYRAALRGMRRSFAALSPVAAGPLAIGAKLLGLGGAGGGAAAGGSAAAGGGAATAGGVATTVGACKVAAVVCTAAITAAGGAVEVQRLTAAHDRDAPAAATTKAVAAPTAAPTPGPAHTTPIAVHHRAAVHPVPERVGAARAKPGDRVRDRKPAKETKADEAITAPLPPLDAAEDEEPVAPADEQPSSGGVQAPDPVAEEPTEPPVDGTTTTPNVQPPPASPAPSPTPDAGPPATATSPPASTDPASTGGVAPPSSR